jgi:hypothetical protein
VTVPSKELQIGVNLTDPDFNNSVFRTASVCGKNTEAEYIPANELRPLEY